MRTASAAVAPVIIAAIARRGRPTGAAPIAPAARPGVGDTALTRPGSGRRVQPPDGEGRLPDGPAGNCRVGRALRHRRPGLVRRRQPPPHRALRSARPHRLSGDINPVPGSWARQSRAGFSAQLAGCSGSLERGIDGVDRRSQREHAVPSWIALRRARTRSARSSGGAPANPSDRQAGLRADQPGQGRPGRARPPLARRQHPVSAAQPARAHRAPAAPLLPRQQRDARGRDPRAGNPCRALGLWGGEASQPSRSTAAASTGCSRPRCRGRSRCRAGPGPT